VSTVPSPAVASLGVVADTPISFARGAPSPELIPAEELADCAHAVALKEGASLFAYGPGSGYGPLREWLAARLGVDPGRVVLTIGGLLGFVLYAGAKLAQRPGRVLVEGPTYDRPLKILAREGAEVVPLAMDDDGLDPDALEAELRRTSEKPSFLYTIPSFQNPSGRTLVEERRRRLAEIAAEHDLDVLEDDPYGLVRYEGEATPTVFALEGGEHVTYTSSFSKTVAPGLRTGYFVLPSAEAAEFEERAVSTYISPPYLAQATIFEFLERGRFEENLEKVRAGLRVRRDAMLGALEGAAPDGVSWNRPEGGYFLWLGLGERESPQVAKAAAERGLNLIPGVDFFPQGSGLGRDAARLAFSYEPVDRVAEGVERLADALTPSA
jgi:2-aminoadipate transaminase